MVGSVPPILLAIMRLAQPWAARVTTRARTVPRPAYEVLLSDLKHMSMVAVRRKYGVSDNAVRKWIRAYEYHRSRER